MVHALDLWLSNLTVVRVNADSGRPRVKLVRRLLIMCRLLFNIFVVISDLRTVVVCLITVLRLVGRLLPLASSRSTVDLSFLVWRVMPNITVRPMLKWDLRTLGRVMVIPLNASWP